MYSYSIPIKNAPDKHYTTYTELQPEITELDNIISEICKAFGISYAELTTYTRVEPIKYARWMLWKIMFSRGVTKIALGRMLGMTYDHTTVMNALTKLPADVQKREWVKAAYMKIMHYDNNPLPLCQ